MSIQTVKNHLTHIFQKTGVDDRTGLAVKALTTGLMMILLLCGGRNAKACTVENPQPTGNCAVDFASLPVGASPRMIAATFTPDGSAGLQVVYGYGQASLGKTAGIYILDGVPYFWGYGEASDFACSAPALTAGQKVSVAFTYNGQTIACFVNGQAAGTGDRPLDTGQAFASIGNSDQGAYPFAGTIQSIKIGAFETPEEIAADYAGATQPQWPFVTTYGLLLKMSYDPATGWDFAICPQGTLDSCGKLFTTPLTSLTIPDSILPSDVPVGLYVMPYREGPTGVYFKIGVFQN